LEFRACLLQHSLPDRPRVRPVDQETRFRHNQGQTLEFGARPARLWRATGYPVDGSNVEETREYTRLLRPFRTTTVTVFS